MLTLKTRALAFFPFTKRDLSILLGNTLDHFDTALYGFLAPLLAPIFFPNHSTIVQLILTYSVLASSLVTRPLGSFVFGSLARRKGPMLGLSWSLIGVGVMTFSLGLLPSYDQIGWLAPLSLIIVRMLKGIFAAGETTIAKMYIMEDKKDSWALRVSHFYQTSTMVGILFASAISTFVIASHVSYGWRLCFLFGGVVGIAGYFLRKSADHKDHLPSSSVPIPHQHSAFFLWERKKDIVLISIIYGFSYMTYAVPCIFMNSFVPLVTSISLETMIALNTLILCLDMVLIPTLGHLLRGYSPPKIMLTACAILAITLIPLFQFLPNASLAYVVFVRIWIVFWGVIYMCPLNFWLKNLLPPSGKYLVLGMAGSLGSTVLGRLITPFCLWLWSISEWTLLPGLCMGSICALTIFVIQGTSLSKSPSLKPLEDVA